MKNIIELNWQLYDESQSQKCGIYLWLHHGFNHAPYYVGIAHKDSFGNRIKTHAKNFGNLGYTFFRRHPGSLTETHKQFADALLNLQVDSSEKALYVPGSSVRDELTLKESKRLWEYETTILIATSEKEKRLLESIESKIQYNLEAYYSSLNPALTSFSVPRSPRSTFFGQREVRDRRQLDDLSLSHKFESETFKSSAAFFDQLSSRRVKAA